MQKKIYLNRVYIHSEKIVARLIEDELIIVPVEAGTFDAEFDYSLYSLKGIGRIIWEMLDKKITVQKLCSDLALEYNATNEIIKKDVIELLSDLLAKNIIAESV